jgi:predicted TIM-barrel fold metal-dependent hydrolase
MLPLLDSLAHPTLSGGWLGRPVQADFSTLVAELDGAGYMGACAIGLDGVEDYDHARFIEHCRAHPCLIPIAGFNPASDARPERMRALRRMGYRGVKIHPRFSGLTHHLDRLGPALRAAGEADLTVFFCTYLHCALASHPLRDPYYSLVELLHEAPDTRMILVHGGDVEVLRYAELVRFNANLLLDLSLTLMKYQGSSVDLDLAFLFRHFDRRICIGTDWPEYGPRQIRERFKQFAGDLPGEKRHNIAYRNLYHFLGLDDDFRPLHPVAAPR